MQPGNPRNRQNSSMDVRGSQRGLGAAASTAGLEKRILKGGQNIMRNTAGVRGTSQKTRKYRTSLC